MEPSGRTAAGVSIRLRWKSGYGLRTSPATPENWSIGSKGASIVAVMSRPRAFADVCVTFYARAGPGSVGIGRRRPRPKPDPARRCGPAGPSGLRPACRRAPGPARNGPGTREPSAAPSGTAVHSTGSPVQSASACTHSSTRVPPPVAMIRRGVTPCAARRGVDGPPGDEPGRLERGAPERGGAVGQIEVGQHRAPVGIVQRDPFTARVRRPHRHPVRVRALAGRDVAQRRGRPVHEQSARVARTAGEELVLRGVRDHPVAVDRFVARRHRVHDERRAEQHEHVTVVVRARDDLVGERVDAARREHRAVGATDPAALPRRRHEPGQLLDARRRAGRRPPDPSWSSRTAGTRSTRSTCRAPPRR